MSFSIFLETQVPIEVSCYDLFINFQTEEFYHG